jgi:hypothetical protein
MRTHFWHSAAFLLALAVSGAQAFGASSIGASQQIPAVPENGEARTLLRDTIFAPVGEAAAQGPLVVEQSSGEKVSYHSEKQSDALYLVFANRQGRSYPLAGTGTFIIKRSLRDGSFLHAKVFLQNDPGCYLRLFPRDDRTVMDIVLFGTPFQSEVALPSSFERLLTAPLSRIMDLSSGSVDWPLVLSPAQSQEDARLSQVVNEIRGRLKGLRDMDDGAMDSAGRLVAIATGQPAPARQGGFNCSGFAKWVVDGFYAPLAGSDMDINALKSRNASRENRWSARLEEELDPYFGLDWSRGLARSIFHARTGSPARDEQIDVRDAERVPYVTDAGYPVASLRSVLYFLARKDPGTLYLGSVNAPSSAAVREGIPMLRQHHHVVVLFPWFDARGTFQVVVMERNLETSLASLDRRYGSEFVHLVRIDTGGPFSLPRFE